MMGAMSTAANRMNCDKGALNATLRFLSENLNDFPGRWNDRRGRTKKQVLNKLRTVALSHPEGYGQGRTPEEAVSNALASLSFDDCVVETF